ncbi:DUF4159 domain-containing protein [Candidatus Riflebacteria bacterium]
MKMLQLTYGITFLFLFFHAELIADTFRIARLKYDGGGDWYQNRTSLKRLQASLAVRFGLNTGKEEITVNLREHNLFNYPFLVIFGHGNIRFSPDERIRLKTYLTHGGFLWVDDDYGLDKAFRREIAKVFPDSPLIELPHTHQIYQMYYDFPNGLPKIHEHDGGPPHGYGLFYKGRMVVFYSFNTDIGDGMEVPGIHPQDSAQIQEEALKMGINIVFYALTH